MRDPDRIWKFSNRFAAFWYTYCPDLRFLQVVDAVALFFDDKLLRNDPFFAEETDWEKAIDLAAKYFEKHQKNY